MSRLTVCRTDVAAGPLMLVNAQHPLRPEERLQQDLVTFGRAPGGGELRLERAAALMMRCLIKAAGGEGAILPVSGYRSRRQQARIYEATLREKGEAYTKRYVALPGCSEHETGLALDVTDAAEPYDFVCPAFPNRGACARLRGLAPLYGFVERYPKGKTHITGIAHEPWHYRYVGWPHARNMAEHGLCLEEYLQWLAGYDSFENALICQKGGYSIHCFTVPMAGEEETLVELPKGVLWQASGNNMSGVVMTVWS